MAKRSLKATIPEKKTNSKIPKIADGGVVSKEFAEKMKMNIELAKGSYIPDSYVPVAEYESRISKLEGQIEVLLSKPVIAGTKLITPSKVDSILRKMYGLPVQAGSKKLVPLVNELVKDPEHAYFIIRHQRDKKLLDAYYSILAEDNLPAEPEEES